MKLRTSSIKNVILMLPLIGITLTNCKKETIQSCATYEKDIKPLLANSCSYSGCHAGTNAGLYVPKAAKDFTNYAGLKESIDNGKLMLRAVELGDMPNPVYTPEGHPKSLTKEEKDMITCWINEGAVEN